MNRKQYAQFIILIGTIVCLLVSTGFAQQGGKKEYTFRGKVEKVDTQAKTLTVNGEKVEGWMNAMTMNYQVDKEDVLKNVKIGDQISAKVYEGDFKKLYNVQVVPPKK